MFCRKLHFVNSLQPTKFLIGQTEKKKTPIQMLYDKNTRQIILLHLPRATGKFLYKKA